MTDRRFIGSRDYQKPAQWHQISVYNEGLGAHAVQQLAKDSSVYVEGGIEIRVCNDGVSGEVKEILKVSVRHDGKIHHITSGNRLKDISFDDRRK